MSDVSTEVSQTFRALVKARARMTIIITVIIFLLLSVNILLMSSWAELGAKPLYKEAHITVVLAYSIFVIFAGAMISAFYIWWANNVLDKLVFEAREEITGGVSS